MTFELALPHVLRYEGGYVNNPNDPGGATNMGVTQAVYNGWRKARGLPVRSVKEISQDEVALIYRGSYWDAVKADELPAYIRLAVFDCAVNCGTGTAIKLLQEAAGADVDGQLGAKTLAAVKNVQPAKLMEDFLWLRARYYARITAKNKKLREFLAGWIFRLIEVRKTR